MTKSHIRIAQLVRCEDGAYRVCDTFTGAVVTIVPDWLADLMHSADSADDFANYMAFVVYNAKRKGFADGRDDFAREMREMLGAEKKR